MTSTNPGENGYWFDYNDAMHHPELAPHHRGFFERVSKLKVLEREAAFTEQAMKNLKANPKGVAHNWVCNTVRLFLGFPRSHRPEELATLAFVVFNGSLLVLGGCAVGLVGRRPGSFPKELWFLGIFTVIYLGGSTLASSLARYFLVVTPLLWPVVAAAITRNVSLVLTSR
jgi:hypothetical protein